MSVLIANNATTILASAINAVVTSIPLSPGTGALFPNPTGGDFFYGTLQSASNPNQLEIVRVTARATDTLTVVRGQDGTMAQSFNVSDVFALLPTRATESAIRNVTSLPTAGGTANALTTTNSVPLAFLAKGAVQELVPAAPNTTAATLAADGTAATAIKAWGQALIGGEMQTGVPVALVGDGVNWNLLNPLITTLGLASGALEVTLVTVNGNFTPKTSGTYLVVAFGSGGGGGGGGGSGSTTCGRHGTGGEQGQMVFSIQTLVAGTPYAIVIGAVGTAGTAGSIGNAGGNGGGGGSTTFNGAAVTALGGAGGIAGVASSTDTARGYTGTGGIGPGGGQGGTGGAVNTAGAAGSAATGTVGAGGGGGGGAGSGGGGSAGGAGAVGAPGMVVVIRA